MALANNFRTWRTRVMFNLFPCFRRTGARITSISPDEQTVKLKIPLNWTTRGYFGTTFGGSIYGATDPVLMVMLNRLLGRGYVVWDKAAHVEFKKPGRSTLFATFHISDEELAGLRQELEATPRLDRTYTVDLVDAAGTVHATVEKVLHFRKRST